MPGCRVLCKGRSMPHVELSLGLVSVIIVEGRFWRSVKDRKPLQVEVKIYITQFGCISYICKYVFLEQHKS